MDKQAIVLVRGDIRVTLYDAGGMAVDRRMDGFGWVVDDGPDAFADACRILRGVERGISMRCASGILGKSPALVAEGGVA